MKRKQTIGKLQNLITAANGKRRAHIILSLKAEDIYDVYIQTRIAVKRLHHDPRTVSVIYDPHCVPNCYKWRVMGTVARIDADGAPHAAASPVKSRSRGRKWSWKITFTPDGKHAVPEGFTSTGVKRI